jgi:hypothetical protein
LGRLDLDIENLPSGHLYPKIERVTANLAVLHKRLSARDTHVHKDRDPFPAMGTGDVKLFHGR